MVVIGLDLGTTHSADAVMRGRFPEITYLNGKRPLPSLVGLRKDGRVAVGKTAEGNQARHPQNTVAELQAPDGQEDHQ